LADPKDKATQDISRLLQHFCSMRDEIYRTHNYTQATTLSNLHTHYKAVADGHIARNSQ